MNVTQYAICASIVALVVAAVVYLLNPIAPDCGSAMPRYAGLPALVLALYMILPLYLARTVTLAPTREPATATAP